MKILFTILLSTLLSTAYAQPKSIDEYVFAPIESAAFVAYGLSSSVYDGPTRDMYDTLDATKESDIDQAFMFAIFDSWYDGSDFWEFNSRFHRAAIVNDEVFLALPKFVSSYFYSSLFLDKRHHTDKTYFIKEYIHTLQTSLASELLNAYKEKGLSGNKVIDFKLLPVKKGVASISVEKVSDAKYLNANSSDSFYGYPIPR